VQSYQQDLHEPFLASWSPCPRSRRDPQSSGRVQGPGGIEPTEGLGGRWCQLSVCMCW
jgi:hypothetical protein